MTDIFDQLRADFTPPFNTSFTNINGGKSPSCSIRDARGYVVLKLSSPVVNHHDRCALAAKIADILNNPTTNITKT